MRVLVAEAISQRGIELLREQHEVDVKKLTKEELLEQIGLYDAVITRSETKITADVLKAGTRLKVVGRAGVGVDNIDVEAATERGVVVVNVPGANTLSTAEHAFGLLLALARHIPQAHHAMVKEGRWDRKTYVGTEIYGKSLGIIGLGRIGSEVAIRARAFGMKLYAYDPYVSATRAEQLGVILVPSVGELLPLVDFLTIHAAKTAESARLIGWAELAKMRKGARIINCARGGMVDEDALYAAIVEGHIGGAALDVFATEPCTDHKLFTLPNVVFTPHLSASTVEAQEANGTYIAQYVLRVLAGELVPEAVNLPQVPKEQGQELVRHLPLAEALGSFLAQAYPDRYEAIEVIYSGELAALPTTLATNSVLKGFLGAMLGEAVNYINAPSLANRRGLRVQESKVTAHPTEGKRPELAPEASLITVRVVGAKGEYRIAGMLRRDGGIRFTAIDGMPIDLAPSRTMLVTRHQDRPGMVGKLGSLLGSADINIAGLHLSRKGVRGEALMLMQVDDLIPSAVLEQIRQVDGIMAAQAVTLPGIE
jgi:D-3-phosphoglycerate dehydrogenase